MFGLLIMSAAAAACPAQAATLRRAAATIEASYHDVQRGRDIAAEVRRWAATGRYSALCADDAAFLGRLNQDLDVYDGHFHVERVAATDSDDWLMSWRKSGRETNMGVRAVQVLEGNIGYLRIASFYPWDMARPRLQAAWALTADVDGLIVDLRQNGGGDADTAGQVVRALLGGTVETVQQIVARGATRPEPLPPSELPAVRPELPVAILLDRRSASAAEFVGYALQAAGRAIVVGQRSAGAANMIGDPVAIGAGIQIAVPNARPVNLRSGTNWEGEGVRPDLPGGDDALHVARVALAGKASRR